MIELIKGEVVVNYNTIFIDEPISNKTEDEKFLEYEINLIEQTLGIAFEGNSIEEKEVFYLQHKDTLNSAKDKILDQIFIAQTAKVIQFGNGTNEKVRVVAESIEQAKAFYKLNTSLTHTCMEALQAMEQNTEVEFMLYRIADVPVGERHIFKKSTIKEDYLEVPLVYAVEYALQKGMKLPCILQSFK